MESKFPRQQETRPFGKQFSRQEETRTYKKQFSWQQETRPHVSGFSLGCCDHNTLCVIVILQPYLCCFQFICRQVQLLWFSKKCQIIINFIYLINLVHIQVITFYLCCNVGKYTISKFRLCLYKSVCGTRSIFWIELVFKNWKPKVSEWKLEN
jgi:hypothetical protein